MPKIPPEEAYSFDDVLLIPSYSDVLPKDVNVSTRLTKNITLNIPIVSAAMDTVTEADAAITMAQEGGMGFIHRNLSIDSQAREVDKGKKSESGMIVDPVTIRPEQKVGEVLELMEHYRISGVPVTSGDQLIGIVTNRDLRFETDIDRKIADVMTKDNLITVSEGISLEESKKLLHKNRIEKLLVVDSEGRLKGLITTKDIEKIKKYPNSCKDSRGRLFSAELEAAERCPRYVGRVIKGVDVSQPSPLWMREKLRRSGIRSIDAIVDVTNYILLELGQPMHAFDFDKLRGGIVVRTAKIGESLDLLDGQTIELKPESLVITDQSGPVALAGIMGGQATAVSSETTNIFLEAAFFTPDLLAGKARSYGLHTDSSHRFERGVDFKLQVEAIERASQLLLDIVGGQAGPVTEVVSEVHLPARPDVNLRAGRIEKMLGFKLDAPEVERILTGLGLGVTPNSEGWTCTVPSWRFDIAIEADLLEELARVYGYNRLPVTHIKANLVMPAKPETQLSLRFFRRHLSARGYREAITYSFVDPRLQAVFDPEVAPVALANPISADMAVMRTSLLPGMVSAVLHNTNRQQPRVRMFETGLRFVPTDQGLKQVPTLAMVAIGQRFAESWAIAAEAGDFFDLKGDLESLLDLTGAPEAFTFAPSARAALHPGQTAAITHKGHEVGYIGALHPTALAELGLNSALFVCEIDLEVLLKGNLPGFAELSKFPEVRRDLAVVVDKDVAAAQLMENVRAVAGSYLTVLRLFDVYEGKGIDPKRKSLALGLTFRDQSRTLSDSDVNKIVDQVIDLLEKNYKAELRN